MAVDVASPPDPRSSAFRRHWRSTSITFKIGLALLIGHVLFAILGPLASPYDPAAMGAGLPLSPMSLAHPFGTDMLGRDVFARVAHGAHLVLFLSISASVIGVSVGTAIGLFSAYYRGLADDITMRLVEALTSIPYLILALLAITVAGATYSGSPILLILVVALVFAPRVARIARAAALERVTLEYVLAARLRGEGAARIVRRDILPNTMGTMLVEFSMRTSYAPVLIGTLGFLGFGVKPPTPEWGLMIAEYRDLALIAPQVLLAPAIVLASLIIGLNLFTEGLARMLGRTGAVKAGS